MAKICKIHTKDNLWYTVDVQYDDGSEESLLLDQDALVKHEFLSTGEIEEASLRDASKQQEYVRAYQKAVRYLGYRMRAKSEMMKYLLEREVSAPVVSQVCAKLEEQGYLNDAAFAKAYVREQILLSDKGPKALIDHLKKLKIGQDLIQDAIQLYSKEEQEEKIQKLIGRALRKSNKDSKWNFTQKLQQKLIQKGFYTDDVRSAIAVIEWNADRQNDALQKQAAKIIILVQKYDGEFEQRNQFLKRMAMKGFGYDDALEWYSNWLMEQDA